MKLPDTNLWLALALDIHPHQQLASDWLATQRDSESGAFCRSTQQSFLRLLSTAGLMKQYDMEAYSNAQAWDFYQALLADDRLTCLDEPAGLESIWRNLSSRITASPKLWLDAYLAAFAIQANCELVTFDAGFRQFAGLRLELLAVP